MRILQNKSCKDCSVVLSDKMFKSLVERKWGRKIERERERERDESNTKDDYS